MLKRELDIDWSQFRGDCEKCFGLCCVALYFSSGDGFPETKSGGIPCKNLDNDFYCKIHSKLSDRGMRGCIAYDCYGAGQKISTQTYGGCSWLANPTSREEMFQAFTLMRQLQEQLRYLAEAECIVEDSSLANRIVEVKTSTEQLTSLEPSKLEELDMNLQWVRVDALLMKVSEQLRFPKKGKLSLPFPYKMTLGGRADLSAKDLKKCNLSGSSLRGVCLIASDLKGMDFEKTDFIGADLRDADVRGADLSKSIFLTQHQINAAKGDSKTQIPSMLLRPSHWK